MADVYTAPAVKARSVTKSDSTIVNARALYVGGAGDVAVVPLEDATSKGGSGTTVTFSAVPAGTILPVSCERVMNATTATLIVALY